MPDERPSSPDPSSPDNDPAEEPTTQAPEPDATTEQPSPEAEPTQEQAQATPNATRRLLRSREDRVIGGVCGGLAKYFNIDPLIVRIAAVALIFLGGVSIFAYVAALLLVPDDDGTGQPAAGKPGRLSTLVGVVVIVIGGVVLLDGNWGLGWGWVFGALAPAALIVAVLAIAGQRLLAGRGENRPTAGRIAGAALLISGIGLGVLALAAGGAVATAAGGGAAIAAVVIVMGLVMVALAFGDEGRHTRRARWLVLPALALAVPSGVVAAAGIETDNGVGSRHYAPATIADLKPGGYELGVGELQVDLRRMDWPQASTVNLKVDVGTGHALVLVPDDVCVQADTHAGIGYVGVLGQEDGGADVDEQRGTVMRTSGRRLVLDADMGIGAIEVRHSRVHEWRGWREHGGTRGPDEISATLADAGCAGARA